MRRILLFLITLPLLVVTACGNKDEERAAALTGGDPDRGRELIRQYGCYTCHTIPGVPGGEAHVGPPLDQLAKRNYIAGVLENSPENLARWIKDPPGINPKTAMPKLGVSDEDVRDISSYLYTLK